MLPKLLICSAVKSEQDKLIHFQYDSIMFRTVGIGIIESTIRATEVLSLNKSIETVLFTGTCGAYPNSNLRIGDIISAEKYLLIGAGSLLDIAYLPKKMSQIIEFPLPDILPLKRVSSATVLEITRDNNLANKISEKYDADIEHMELFSLALLAQRFNKRFISILGISNYVSKESHEGWMKNHEIVSQKTQQVVTDFIKKCLQENGIYF